jgi:DNA-binding NarL/FixJ family response regulator
MMIKQVIIFDNYPVYRDGEKLFFEIIPDFHVVGTAGTEKDLFALLERYPADMVLLGVNLPDRLGSVNIARRLRNEYPAVKILAFVDDDATDIIQSIMEIGINGYIGKQKTGPVELENAVRKVTEDGEYIGSLTPTQKKNNEQIIKNHNPFIHFKF